MHASAWFVPTCVFIESSTISVMANFCMFLCLADGLKPPTSTASLPSSLLHDWVGLALSLPLRFGSAKERDEKGGTQPMYL